MTDQAPTPTPPDDSLPACPRCGAKAQVQEVDQAWLVHCVGDGCRFGARRRYRGEAIAVWIKKAATKGTP